MPSIVLRDYQLQLLVDLRAALKVHRRVCAVIQGAARKGRKVLVLAHRDELIEQLTGTVRAWGLEPDVIAGLGTGEVEVLTSCMIISEGTDIP